MANVAQCLMMELWALQVDLFVGIILGYIGTSKE